MKKNTNKGFTLIELLVVIAIIGILSSVVLASLNSARNKGTDAAVKAQLASMRPQAELFYDTNSSNGYGYATSSVTTPVSGCVLGFLASSTNMISAITNTGATTTCFIGTNLWAVSASLKGGGAWCVDGNGSSKSGVATATGC